MTASNDKAARAFCATFLPMLTDRQYTRVVAALARLLERENMSKPTYIKLSYPHPNMDRDYNSNADPQGKNRQVYRVEQIDNSTEFVPGQQLTKAQVSELCESSRWDVKQVPASRV